MSKRLDDATEELLNATLAYQAIQAERVRIDRVQRDLQDQIADLVDQALETEKAAGWASRNLRAAQKAFYEADMDENGSGQ